MLEDVDVGCAGFLEMTMSLVSLLNFVTDDIVDESVGFVVGLV